MSAKHTPGCINHDDEMACTCGTYRKHTTGQWEARKNASNGYAIRDNLDRLIAEIPFQRGDVRLGAPGEAQSANARLISAAPELLEALVNAGNLLRGMELRGMIAHKDDAAIVEMARAAIAKAKGE